LKTLAIIVIVLGEGIILSFVKPIWLGLIIGIVLFIFAVYVLMQPSEKEK